MKFSYKKFVLLIIFLVLLVSNIIFFYLYISNYLAYDIDLDTIWNFLNGLFAIIAAIIILGFITTRLPQFRNMGDSSIYEVGYLIVIGLLSMLISYFNKSAENYFILDPFIDVFKVLSILLILVIIAAKTKAFKSIINGKIGWKALFYCFIIFSILGCVSSMYAIPVKDSIVSVRELIVLVSGLFGGPFVGIPVGFVAGGFRFLYGGATALPCTLSTIIAGFLGSIIYICNDRKFLKGFPSIVLMFLYTGFSMLLIVLLTPPNISIPYVSGLYPLMVFSSVLGIILFRMIVKEQKTGKNITYEELRIRELENTLDEYEDRFDKLEEDVELLKKNSDYFEEEEANDD